MGLGRHPARLLFVVCLLTVSAAPAVGNTLTRSLTFTTGQFVVNCTSSGEVCSPPKKLTFNLRRNSTLTSIVYTTAATHCSAVRLHVLKNGHQIAETGRLSPGMSTVRLGTRISLKQGVTTLGFQAQGFAGGCNAGHL